MQGDSQVFAIGELDYRNPALAVQRAILVAGLRVLSKELQFFHLICFAEAFLIHRLRLYHIDLLHPNLAFFEHQIYRAALFFSHGL
jgi:hypothetical protein